MRCCEEQTDFSLSPELDQWMPGLQKHVAGCVTSKVMHGHRGGRRVCKVRRASFMELGVYCAMPCTKHLASLLSFNSHCHLASLVAQMVRNTPATWETWVRSVGWEDPLKEGVATHSSSLAWEIPWTEDSGGLESMGSHKVGHK